MVEFEIPDKWISNTLKVCGALIVLVMVVTLIRPSVTGNVVNRLNVVSSDLLQCELLLNETMHLLENSEDAVYMLTGDISEINSALYSCSYTSNSTKTSLQNITSSYNVLFSKHSELVSDYEELSADYNRSSIDYLELAHFSAEKLCCIRKLITSPEIQSYDIVMRDNEIICREFRRGAHDLSSC